jgi:hypothetical protein
MAELPGGERDRIVPSIEELHMLISEMDDRIEYIRDNCTPETGIDDIRTEREEFDKHLATLRVKTDEAMRGWVAAISVAEEKCRLARLPMATGSGGNAAVCYGAE